MCNIRTASRFKIQDNLINAIHYKKIRENILHLQSVCRGGSSILCELLPFQNNPTVSIDRRRREKLGGSGGIPPRKILKIGLSEMPFSAL